jgi:membrane-anchored protein YejM (alkaline phosphatase superfamily)
VTIFSAIHLHLSTIVWLSLFDKPTQGITRTARWVSLFGRQLQFGMAT